MKLKKNLNLSGRLLRGSIAFILLILGLKENSTLLLVASLFVFLEAIFSYCVLFGMLGINQLKKKK
jgi:hypothetical protein